MYSHTGETAIVTAPKAASSGKDWICIFIQTNSKRQWFRVDAFFWETITLYTVHFQIYNFAGCFHSLRDVTHCMKGHFQKSIRGNLRSTFECLVWKFWIKKKALKCEGLTNQQIYKIKMHCFLTSLQLQCGWYACFKSIFYPLFILLYWLHNKLFSQCSKS